MRACVENNRVVNQLNTFDKTSLPRNGTGLKHWASSIGISESNSFLIFVIEDKRPSVEGGPDNLEDRGITFLYFLKGENTQRPRLNFGGGGLEWVKEERRLNKTSPPILPTCSMHLERCHLYLGRSFDKGKGPIGQKTGGGPAKLHIHLPLVDYWSIQVLAAPWSIFLEVKSGLQLRRKVSHLLTGSKYVPGENTSATSL